MPLAAWSELTIAMKPTSSADISISTRMADSSATPDSRSLCMTGFRMNDSSRKLLETISPRERTPTARRRSGIPIHERQTPQRDLGEQRVVVEAGLAGPLRRADGQRDVRLANLVGRA